MPFNILSLPGLQRFKNHLSRVLTSKTLNDSVTGQYTFQAKPLFNDNKKLIDRLFEGNLVIVDVQTKETIRSTSVENAENLDYDINTAPEETGFEFVSIEYDETKDKCYIYYIPTENPAPSDKTSGTYTSINLNTAYLNNGVVPNTKNLWRINFSDSALMEIPRFYGKNALQIQLNGCQNVKEFPKFKTSSNLILATRMFKDCTSLEKIHLFDTSNVVEFSEMFFNCSSLTEVPLFDMSGARSMGAWQNPISGKWSYTFNGQPYANNMFDGCSSLTTVPSLNFSQITQAYNLFNNCTSLKTVPTLNTVKNKLFNSFFKNCSSLETVQGLNLTACSNTTDMFSGCTSLREVHIDFGNNSNSSLNTLFNGLTFGANQMINLYVKNIPQSVRSAIQSSYGAHVTIIDE